MRVSPEHLCPRPPRRRDNRRIGACAGDIQSASHAPAQGLGSALEGDKFRVDIVFREEAHLLGDVWGDMDDVRRRDRNAKDNFPLRLRLNRR